jgi:hypothetical protein
MTIALPPRTGARSTVQPTAKMQKADSSASEWRSWWMSRIAPLYEAGLNGSLTVRER